MTSCKLTISLSNNTLDEIKRYKKVMRKQSIEEAVTELINYALSLPLYFKNFNWKDAEDEANVEILSGKCESFDTLEDFISDIQKCELFVQKHLKKILKNFP